MLLYNNRFVVVNSISFLPLDRSILLFCLLRLINIKITLINTIVSKTITEPTAPAMAGTEFIIFELPPPGMESEEETNIMVVTDSLLFINVGTMEDKVTTDKDVDDGIFVGDKTIEEITEVVV